MTRMIELPFMIPLLLEELKLIFGSLDLICNIKNVVFALFGVVWWISDLINCWVLIIERQLSKLWKHVLKT